MNSLPISIDLPEGFLNEETRCGYTVPEKLKKVWAVQLDLLRELLEVCRRNDIKLVAWAGTMLGAVRHKGFIPWDDDVDVAMDRENYEKLLRLPASEFRAPYFLQTARSDPRYFLSYARFRNSATTCIIQGFDSPEYNNGIYIDIFPLDGCVDSEIVRVSQWFVKSLVAAMINDEHHGLSRNPTVVSRVLHLARPIWRLVGRERLIRLHDGVVSLFTAWTPFLAPAQELWIIRKYRARKEELRDIVEIPFENLSVPVPRAYQSVLSRIYGDYMSYPSAATRGKWHEGLLRFDPETPYTEFMSQMTEVARSWFVTFADSRMTRPLARIRRQALQMGFSPERILTMTERDLDADFRERMKDQLVKGSRGYGYWCWRPQVVLQALRRISDGDILLYADAGCHLNPKGLPRLRDYLKMANEFEMVAFQGRSLLGTEKYDPLHHYNSVGMWTKGDVLDYFGVRENSEVINSGQYSGGVFLVKKTGRTKAFYERYRTIAVEHPELFDDSPFKSPNLPEFREHRHDQAVFTLLCKEQGVRTLSCCEYGVYASLAPKEFQGDSRWSCRSFEEMDRFPVHARRDTSFGIRAYIPRPVKNVLLKIGQKVFSR